MTQVEVRIVDRTVEAEDIVSFVLAPINGSHLPAFAAGSHIDVQLPGGIVRQYSLCGNDARQDCYRIGILRDPASRGGSIAAYGMKVGDVIQIGEPKNHFSLRPSAHALLLAGGIGITPLLCMSTRLAATDGSFELHYCTRSPARTAFRKEVAAFGPCAFIHFDDGAPEQKLALPSVLAAQPADTRIYVCGPGGFIDFVKRTAEEAGWDSDRVHFEFFAPPAHEEAAAGSFRVRIASTGQEYLVPPDKAVTTVLAENGIDIMMSCEQGVCGTCLTRVLQGECDHRDYYLSDDEKARNDQFTPCCSRAKSDLLILDL